MPLPSPPRMGRGHRVLAQAAAPTQPADAAMRALDIRDCVGVGVGVGVQTFTYASVSSPR
ncbi:hypothetical protein ABZ572_34990 [Streptomyces sp. NPDC018338]|uniref:hypothetical protein n=1 Tax=Streptomyces sp. NPDC018338 TaxID=3157192 RepID=UPI0033FDB7C0